LTTPHFEPTLKCIILLLVAYVKPFFVRYLGLSDF
jgi:hypothetical protein